MKTKVNQLNALYYPYADLTSSQKILESAIYFENIYILEPNFFRALDQGAASEIPSSPDMGELINSGIVKPIGPELIGLSKSFGLSQPILDEESAEVLLKSIQRDLGDNDLRDIASKYGYAYWSIPTGQQLFRNGLGLLLEVSKYDSNIGIEIHTDRPDYYSQLMASSGYLSVPVIGRTMHRVRSNSAELQVKVSFLEAESLMINVALLACSELDLCPLTDSKLHHEFLVRKLSNPQLREVVRTGIDNITNSIREYELAIKNTQIYLPKISNLTVEKVIRIRRSCQKPLERYRVHMGKLKHLVESEPWSPDFHAEIAKIVETEINPAVLELQESLNDRSKEFGIKLLGDVAQAAPLPLLLTFATGIPVGWVLSASAGLVVLKDYLEYCIKKGELKRNGLFFLIDVGSK